MNPSIDYHAFAPELVLSGAIVVVLVADLVFPARARVQTSRIAAIGVLAALVPVLTLAYSDTRGTVIGDWPGYVIDNYSLALKGLFLVAAYITVLLSFDYVEEGDYQEGEYYFLLLTSLLGMIVMASARDLITIFVALETISIPTFVLAAWRKHDRKSSEAGIKYYVIGVLSSAVMLYGMSLVFGLTGSTLLVEIAAQVRQGAPALMTVAIFLTLVGFAFKISAVPFHFWVPDTYEGAPTPVTAFLSVASKAGGFVALLTMVYVGFIGPDRFGPDAWGPVLWIMAALSMTLGNVTALRQTNIVRMLAYSSIAQGGFILVPLAVAQDPGARQSSFEAVVIYLLVYGAMNLGAFATVIAVARRTKSGDIASYAGLGRYAPWLSVVMSIFMFSLVGIPPLAGWFAKFVMFRAALEASNGWATALAVIAAINSVIAFVYYSRVAREMWFREAPADVTPARTPPALAVAIGLCAIATVAIGVYPQVFGKVGELATPGAMGVLLGLG